MALNPLKATVEALIAGNLADNITNSITPELHRAVCTILLEWAENFQNSDNINQGALNLLMTVAERAKLAGISAGAEVNPDLISQAEAEAGTASTERIFSAERVKQAIVALGISDSDDLTEGVVQLLLTVAERAKLAGISAGAEVNPDLISQAEAEAGVAATERIFSAERVKQAVTALGGALFSVLGHGHVYANISDFDNGVDANVTVQLSDTHRTSDGSDHSAVVLNTAKVTNANHSGHATGAGALTAQPAIITDQALVTGASGDLVLASRGGVLKKIDAVDFLGGGGGGLTWNTGITTNQSTAVNNAYQNDGATGALEFLLPDTAAAGDKVLVVGVERHGIKITQNAGDYMSLGAKKTTTGTGGFVEASGMTNMGDKSIYILLTCVQANTNWMVESFSGIWVDDLEQLFAYNSVFTFAQSMRVNTANNAALWPHPTNGHENVGTGISYAGTSKSLATNYWWGAYLIPSDCTQIVVSVQVYFNTTTSAGNQRILVFQAAKPSLPASANQTFIEIDSVDLGTVNSTDVYGYTERVIDTAFAAGEMIWVTVWNDASTATVDIRLNATIKGIY